MMINDIKDNEKNDDIDYDDHRHEYHYYNNDNNDHHYDELNFTIYVRYLTRMNILCFTCPSFVMVNVLVFKGPCVYFMDHVFTACVMEEYVRLRYI